MKNRIKIGIVEDQQLFREGIISILSGSPNIEVVFESPDGFSVLDRLNESEEVPDVMLIDLTLPPNGDQEFGGLQVLEVLRENHPQVKNLILSVHDDKYVISKMIENGAQGYLVKDSDADEVLRAIENVYENASYINDKTLLALQSKLQGKVKPPKAFDQLTSREVEVLKLICQQMTSEEIAEELFISAKTVNGHRNNLLQKTGSRNVTGLVMYAVKNGLVELI